MVTKYASGHGECQRVSTDSFVATTWPGRETPQAHWQRESGRATNR
jgi:hypothetical protein